MTSDSTFSSLYKVEPPLTPAQWSKLHKEIEALKPKYSAIRMGWAAYEKLKRLAVPATNQESIGSIFGLRVYVDPDMKPNEWKFE